jgi:hypothetical protein
MLLLARAHCHTLRQSGERATPRTLSALSAQPSSCHHRCPRVVSHTHRAARKCLERAETPRMTAVGSSPPTSKPRGTWKINSGESLRTAAHPEPKGNPRDMQAACSGDPHAIPRTTCAAANGPCHPRAIAAAAAGEPEDQRGMEEVSCCHARAHTARLEGARAAAPSRRAGPQQTRKHNNRPPRPKGPQPHVAAAPSPNPARDLPHLA